MFLKVAKKCTFVKKIALKILVVEDYPINQHIMKVMLSNMGHECIIAENGKMGVDFFHQERFDMILMDLQMPVMDGFETISYIRKYEKENAVIKTPIIALTAQIMNNEEEFCHELGTDGFLSKPVNIDILRNKMNEVLNK